MSKQRVGYMLADNIMVIEGRADEFSREWRAAAPQDRVVLDDKRPAVRHRMSEGTLYFTPHPEAWERMKRLPRGRLIVAGRTRLCEFCSSEMRVAREYHDVWTFVCPSCKSSEVQSKALVGGTRGAGEQERT